MLSNSALNLLYQRSYKVENVVDPYSYLGVQIPQVVRLLLTQSLLKEPKLNRGIDIPTYIYDFIVDEGSCICIFNIVAKQVLSITLRSRKEKRFITYQACKSIPLGFGFFANDFTYDKPVVVVEGPKDLFSLYDIYPNIIATQTAGTSTVVRKFLKGITNKVILVGDNDESGLKAFYLDRKLLTQMGITVYRVEHPLEVKDCGEIIDKMFKGDYDEAYYLKEYYRNLISVYL